MKQFVQLVLLLVFCVSLSVIKGQVIESFDTDLSADSTYDLNIEGGLSRMDYTLNTSDFKEGTGAGEVDFVIGAYHQWGSYAQIIKRVPDGATLLDWSISDSLSIWVKVLQAPVFPANMVFRIQIADRPNDTDPIEEYIYENATVLDVVGDWYELKVPLFERLQPGTVIPNDQGFILAPTSWGGFGYNNRKLDFDKIVGYNISAITSGWDPAKNLPADSVLVRLDGFKRFGVKAVPAIIFNGIAVPSGLSAFNWGGPAAELIEGAGASAGHNALKWTQGDSWCGFGWNINPAFQMAGSWPVDSLKFKMKAESGVGNVRAQFEATGGKKGIIFTPIDDNAWHSYTIALKDFVYKDGTSGFDSSQVGVFQFLAEGNGVNGKIVYFDDIWTGNPEFDVIPPAAPLNVLSFGQTNNTNTIVWDDVPGETGEKYDVYFSSNPITDIKASGVETVVLNHAENDPTLSHLLIAPVTNQSVTYYYAVTCTDASGNKSVVSLNSASLTNTAKGITTISKNPPAAFVADGDLSEWQSITSFRMFISDGSGHKVTNSKIDNDADCSALVWVATDATYLYVAFDIFDDVFTPNISGNSWENDASDLFIGLYNYHGLSHTGYKRGAEPDYHFRFAYNRVIIDNLGATADTLDSGDYYFGEAFSNPGYRVEFRITWTDLAAFGNDNVFTPTEGFRIPIDFEINDADGALREGMLTYAPSEDKSYQDVSRWTYTWIGSLWNPVGVEYEGQPVSEYALTQNYPNPFNPSTQIKFALKESGYVTLKVYDALGKEVATLVKGDYASGSYNVSFDASGLSSGIYFYRLETSSYVQTNKMMLLK